MARRKRLSPVALTAEPDAPRAPETKSTRPPIASVVADAATQSGLGEALRFPTALTELQGLALAKKLEKDPKAGEILRQTLEAVNPETADLEAALLAEALHSSGAIKRAATKTHTTEETLPCGVKLRVTPQGIETLGRGADAVLAEKLKSWLADNVEKRPAPALREPS